MTLAAHLCRLPKQPFLLPLALAMTTAATAGDGTRVVHATPLEAPVPLIAQLDQDRQSDVKSSQIESAKPLETARKKVAALLSLREEKVNRKDRSDGRHDHHHKDRPAAVNIIVTVNVNSGNLFGPFGPPRHEDESRSSAGRQELERVLREHEATIDRLRHELETLRNRDGSPEARERAEQRGREFRSRFEQMQQEMRNRMEEMRREREERARQQDAESEAAETVEDAAGQEAADDASSEATEEEATSDPAADEPVPPQTTASDDDLVEFVTSLFD